MPEFAIRRCSLRVVRRSGWSWGSSPRRIAENAMRLLPALIEKSLPGIFDGDQDCEYSAPIELRLRIGIGELQSSLSASHRQNSEDAAVVDAGLAKKFDLALRAALGIPFPSIGEPSSKSKVSSTRSHERGADVGPKSSQKPIEKLLLRWLEDGVLELQISRLSLSELESWIAVLRAATGPPSELSPDQISFLNHELQPEVLAEGVHSRPESLFILRRQILTAARAAEKFNIPITSQELWRQIERVISPGIPKSPDEVVAETSEAEPHESKRRLSAPIEATLPVNNPQLSIIERNVSPLSLNSTWDAHICTALPFLVLAPLRRLDYFETLAATLQAGGLEDSAPLFAVTLARKTLPAPERGWRRTGDADYASAVAAGLQSSVTDESLEDFSRNFTAHLGPVARLLEDRVQDGHAIGTPVTLMRSAAPNFAGWLLVDAPGCFPISFSNDFSQIIAKLALMQRPLVLLDPDSAIPAVVRQLEQARIRFLTNARPGREEAWHRLNRPSDEPLWTNGFNTDTQELRHAVVSFSAAQEEASGMWNDFVVSRPGVPRTAMPDLEQLVSFSAAVSLGLIAWDLWHTRGRTTPQLALERFADFDARVRFDADCITVRLPMGRRYSELRESGLLQPIDGIPWFPGCRVEFNGG